MKRSKNSYAPGERKGEPTSGSGKFSAESVCIFATLTALLAAAVVVHKILKQHKAKIPFVVIA
jgi:hypothetical protein